MSTIEPAIHQETQCWLLSQIRFLHYGDVIMDTMASQITSLTIVYSTVYSGADQRKHQSSASLAFVRGIHRGPVNSPHKVTRKMFPFDDVIMSNFGRQYLEKSEEIMCSVFRTKTRIFTTMKLLFVQFVAIFPIFSSFLCVYSHAVVRIFNWLSIDKEYDCVISKITYELLLLKLVRYTSSRRDLFPRWKPGISEPIIV